MKRLYFLTICSLLCLLCASTVDAQTSKRVDLNNMTFTVTDGKARLDSYYDTDTDVIIPGQSEK